MTSLSYVLEVPSGLDLDGVELWDLYARISDDPGNDELGVRRQVREMTKRIEDRGGKVRAVWIDNDTSAWKRVKNPDGTYSRVPSPRPAWEGLQKAVHAGAARNVMSKEPSRLWRHWADLVPVCDFIESTGIRVESIVSGHLDLSNAGDRMKTRIFGAVSAAESEVKSERLQSKMLELAEDGKFGGGPRPFGFKSNGIDPEPKEQAVIRAWAEGLIAGKSLRDLERESPGLMTPRGKAWTYTTIGQLLKSPRIAGLRQHQGEVIGTAAWAPVIERELWAQVQAILTDPKRKHRAPVKSLLTDFAYIRKGKTLIRMRGGRAVGSRLEDGSYRRLYEAKPGGSIDALKLEEAVEIAVLDATDKTAFLKPTGPGKPVDTSEVDGIEAELAKIKAWRESGKLDLDGYVELRSELVAKLKEAKAKVKEATPKALPTQALLWLSKPGALREHWTATNEDGTPVMSFEDRREALGYVLERVEVMAGASGQRFNADRLRFKFKA